jgi:hypothetical protein
MRAKPSAVIDTRVIVGFDFTGDALFEIDRFRRKESLEIKPLTVREILDAEIAKLPV